MLQGFEGRKPGRPTAGAIVIGLALANVLDIEPGRRGPSDPPEPVWTPEQRQHWSFIPPVRPGSCPPSSARGWVRNPIDAFILQVDGGLAGAATLAPRPTGRP